MKRRIRHGGDLQGGVICQRCNAKAVNLAGGEVRCGEILAVISSAETSEAVKCSAPGLSTLFACITEEYVQFEFGGQKIHLAVV